MHRIQTIVITFFISVTSFMLPSHISANEVITLPNCSFKYSVETTAKKSTVWRLWRDVKNWKKFDTLLEYSYLVNDAEFKTGAIGFVKAKGAPKTKFELIEVKEGEAFSESLKLPLYHSLELLRYFEVNDNGMTTFTHQVNFKGPLKGILYFFLSDTFKEELPLVMGRLKNVAEKEELVDE